MGGGAAIGLNLISKHRRSSSRDGVANLSIVNNRLEAILIFFFHICASGSVRDEAV